MILPDGYPERAHRTAFPESSFDVSDGNGSRIWRIGRNRERIFLEQQGEGQFQCGISYPSDALWCRKAGIYQTAHGGADKLLCPAGKNGDPTAEKQNIYSLAGSEENRGDVPYAVPIKEVLLADRVPPEYCGLCFAAGFLLLHDDDIEIV